MSKEQYIEFPEEYTRRELNARYREIPLKDTTSRLLRKYFNAMANLYGIIPLHKAKEIVFSLSPKLVTEDEFLAFAEIARHECVVLCPLIGGIPYMLYVTKAKKFGMTAIMGFLIGLIMVFFGNGYLTMVTGLVGGLLADVILKKADYKSAKSTVLSCGVFSIWVFGNFAPIFLNRESYMVMLTEGYGAEYAATLNTYMPMWIAPILLVACFVFGLVGGMIGKAICKKHFQRAGIA